MKQLMKMMKMMMSLGVLLPIFAHAGTPTGFDLKIYQHLVAVAIDKGDLIQTGQGYDFKVLKHLAPADDTRPHHADYFSAVGGTGADGHFSAFQVSMVSEDWRKRATGDWEIEQWLWTARLDGTLSSVRHNLLVETVEGSVLDDTTQPSGTADDPAELTRWNAKLQEWSALYPEIFTSRP